MKNKILKPIFLFSIISLFFSCEKDLEFELPELEELIVVQGHFQPDSLWKVSITKTNNSGVGEAFKSLKSATVGIYDGATLLEELTYMAGIEFPETGHFVSTTHRPELGKKYTIKASAANLPDAESTNGTPATAMPPVSMELLGQTPAARAVQFKVGFDDISEGAEYYHLLMRARRVDWEVAGGDTIFTPQPFEESRIELLEGDDELINISSGIDFYQGFFGNWEGVLFNDTGFNKSKFELSFRLRYRSENNGTSGFFTEMQSEVRHVDEAYFNYWRSILLQEQNAEDPFAEPSFVFNNIAGGIGNFSGYNVGRSEVLRVEE